MHIISTITILALLGIAVSVIANMLVTYRHAIMGALRAEPASTMAFPSVGSIVHLHAADANDARISTVDASRSDRAIFLALAA